LRHLNFCYFRNADSIFDKISPYFLKDGIFPVECFEISNFFLFEKFVFITVPGQRILLDPFWKYMNKMFFSSYLSEEIEYSKENIKKKILTKRMRREIIIKRFHEPDWFL